MNYGYVIGDVEQYIKLFSEKGSKVQQVNVLYDSLNDKDTKPNLDVLIDKLTEKDKVLAPSFEHLGTSMNDVIFTINSILMTGAKLKIIDPSDAKLIKSMGGYSAFCGKVKTIFTIQSRVLKGKRKAGIEKAKKKDKQLKTWNKTDVKYKGRPAPTFNKIAPILKQHLEGNTHTEISKKLGVSRVTIYKYLDLAEKDYPIVISAYNYLHAIEGYRPIKPQFYETLAELLMDLYLSSMLYTHKEIRCAVEKIRKHYNFNCKAIDFIADLNSGFFDEILHLNTVYSPYDEESKEAVTRFFITLDARFIATPEALSLELFYDNIDFTGDQVVYERIIPRVKKLLDSDSTFIKDAFIRFIDKVHQGPLDKTDYTFLEHNLDKLHDEPCAYSIAYLID